MSSILMRCLHSIRRYVNAQPSKSSMIAGSLKGAKAPRPLALCYSEVVAQTAWDHRAQETDVLL